MAIRHVLTIHRMVAGIGRQVPGARPEIARYLRLVRASHGGRELLRTMIMDERMMTDDAGWARKKASRQGAKA
jgi:hypothetical protein